MADPLLALSDVEFRKNFRFSKEHAGQILQMVLPNLSHASDKGHPLTPMQQLCIVLNFYGGGMFQRVMGLCGGVSQKTASRCVEKVTRALVLHKPNHIMMPTYEQMEATAQRMEEKYHLPRFAYAVDGVVVRFDYKPRGIPPGNVAQDYWNRKNCYAINCQVRRADFSM